MQREYVHSPCVGLNCFWFRYKKQTRTCVNWTIVVVFRQICQCAPHNIFVCAGRQRVHNVLCGSLLCVRCCCCCYSLLMLPNATHKLPQTPNIIRIAQHSRVWIIKWAIWCVRACICAPPYSISDTPVARTHTLVGSTYVFMIYIYIYLHASWCGWCVHNARKTQRGVPTERPTYSTTTKKQHTHSRAPTDYVGV